MLHQSIEAIGNEFADFWKEERSQSKHECKENKPSQQEIDDEKHRPYKDMRPCPDIKGVEMSVVPDLVNDTNQDISAPELQIVARGVHDICPFQKVL